jgi:hypothetical protein
MWTWLSGSQGLPLLSYLAHTPSLELQIPDQSCNMDEIKGVLLRLPVVKDLNIDSSEYRTFEDVCNVLRCFEPTLEHLKLEALTGFDLDFSIEVGDIPRRLSAEVLANHTYPIMFPQLKALTSPGFASAELTEWLLRSGIANRIHTPTIVPLIDTDIKHAAMLLRHGGQVMKQLVFEMIAEGWEAQSGIVVLNESHTIQLT